MEREGGSEREGERKSRMVCLFSMQYKILESELSSRTVWLSVWDWDRFGRNQFLGEVRLPLTSVDLHSNSQLWYTLMDKVHVPIIIQLSIILTSINVNEKLHRIHYYRGVYYKKSGVIHVHVYLKVSAGCFV